MRAQYLFFDIVLVDNRESDGGIDRDHNDSEQEAHFGYDKNDCGTGDQYFVGHRVKELPPLGNLASGSRERAVEGISESRKGKYREGKVVLTAQKQIDY